MQVAGTAIHKLYFCSYVFTIPELGLNFLRVLKLDRAKLSLGEAETTKITVFNSIANAVSHSP